MKLEMSIIGVVVWSGDNRYMVVMIIDFDLSMKGHIAS